MNYSAFFLLVTVVLITGSAVNAQDTTDRHTLNGKITDSEGNGLSGVSVYFPTGDTVSSSSGAFAVSLLSGSHRLSLKKTGYHHAVITITVVSDTSMAFLMVGDKDPVLLDEVKIHGERLGQVSLLKGTVSTINRESIESSPSFLGEKDVMRTLQLMPGVSAGSEGSSEIQVRGGTADQNLIMLDGIPLYNSSHLFGMYSSFNPLVVKGAKLYTGAFPASFGGKVSSVIDVSTRDASFLRTSGSAELGLTSGKAHIELPLIKNKLSLLAAGRRSFFEALSLINQSSNKEYFNFYDLNGIVTYKPDSINILKLSSYLEGDGFRYVSKGRDKERDGLIKTQRAVSVNWTRHLIPNLTSNITASYNYYSNTLAEERERPPGENSYHNYFRSSIAATGLKLVLDYVPWEFLQFTAGTEFDAHRTKPSTVYGDNNGEYFEEKSLSDSRVNGIYGFGSASISLKRTTLTTGLRYSSFRNGSYRAEFFEPRVSLYQGVGEKISLKASYSRMTQPIQRLLNPGLGMPMEIIFPSDGQARPQVSDIMTLGFAADIAKGRDRHLSFSIEAYQKEMTNIISFMDGYDTRSVIYNAFGGVYRAGSVHEMILTDGTGRAKGIDLKLDWGLGDISGGISYSISKAENKFDGLNDGEWFAALQDRKHILSTSFLWRINQKWSLSASWMFSTGQPVNVPESYFSLAKPYPGNQLVVTDNFLYSYGARNAHRMIPFHKLDVGFTKDVTVFKMPGQLNFGVYNLYNRQNSSFYFLDTNRADNSTPQVKSLSVFPAMPSISLKINFN